MIRRNFLTGAFASLAASTPSYGKPTLKRGLWRDQLGSFAIGELPEIGKGYLPSITRPNKLVRLAR